ncbi:MAG: hypothetical protein ABFC38_05020, partial [Methanospirillum sp.]
GSHRTKTLVSAKADETQIGRLRTGETRDPLFFKKDASLSTEPKFWLNSIQQITRQISRTDVLLGAVLLLVVLGSSVQAATVAEAY